MAKMSKSYQSRDLCQWIDTLEELEPSAGDITPSTVQKYIIMQGIDTGINRFVLPVNCKFEMSSASKESYKFTTSNSSTFFLGTSVDTLYLHDISLEGGDGFSDLTASITAGSNKIFNMDRVDLVGWDPANIDGFTININNVNIKNSQGNAFSFIDCQGSLRNCRITGTSGFRSFQLESSSLSINKNMLFEKTDITAANRVFKVLPNYSGQVTIKDTFYDPAVFSGTYFDTIANVAIQSFEDSVAEPGVKTQVNSSNHGLTNGDFIVIKDSYDYWGVHVVSNQVFNVSFDITKVFVAGSEGAASFNSGSLDISDARVKSINNQGLENSKIIANIRIQAELPLHTNEIRIIGSGSTGALQPIIDTSDPGTQIWHTQENFERAIFDPVTGRIKFDVIRPTQILLFGSVSVERFGAGTHTIIGKFLLNGTVIADTNFSLDESGTANSITTTASIVVNSRDDYIQFGVQNIEANIDVTIKVATITAFGLNV